MYGLPSYTNMRHPRHALLTLPESDGDRIEVFGGVDHDNTPQITENIGVVRQTYRVHRKAIHL